MKTRLALNTLLFFAVTVLTSSTVFANEKKLKVPFFDGIKFQITNAKPKLTNASHMIHDVNDLTGSNLRDWDTIHIFTFDLVLWKDLSRYFKGDFAISGTTGSLVASGKGLPGTPFEMGIRMRQRYSNLMFWTNLYYYPFTTNYKDKYKSGHIFEPFIAAGLGYTLFRSESVFKVRKSNLLYDRIRNNWYGHGFGYKIMTGFNINPENISPGLKGWVITFSAFYIWNRLKGHSNMHLTDGLEIMGKAANLNFQVGNRMDIDLTGPCFSLAIGHYF